MSYNLLLAVVGYYYCQSRSGPDGRDFIKTQKKLCAIYSSCVFSNRNFTRIILYCLQGCWAKSPTLPLLVFRRPILCVSCERKNQLHGQFWHVCAVSWDPCNAYYILVPYRHMVSDRNSKKRNHFTTKSPRQKYQIMYCRKGLIHSIQWDLETRGSICVLDPSTAHVVESFIFHPFSSGNLTHSI